MSDQLSHIDKRTTANRLQESELRRTAVFIDGNWIEPPDGRTIDVVDCYTETAFAEGPTVSVDEVDRAVTAAATAGSGWAHTPRSVRASMLQRVRECLDERVDRIAEAWAREAGMPIAVGRRSTAGLAFAVLDEMIDILERPHVEERLDRTIVAQEPVGVVAAITPWNYPMSQIAIKTASALAAGCTVVAKPSEVAPLSAFLFADAVADADLPPGVFNLIAGEGHDVGQALASHPLVDAISFTGSTATGRHLMRTASDRIARVTLELGGKSAMVVLDEESLEAAVARTMSSCFMNNGQTCTALTRLVVPERLVDEAAGMAAAIANSQILGDPLDEATTMGPLVSATQRERVRHYIRHGIQEGAQLILGGADAPEGLNHGYFVAPTIFSHVATDMQIAQEEIFGPVLCVLGHSGSDHAVAIANGTRYGLAGSVWGTDASEALRVGRAIRAGTVSVNGGAFNPRAPYGGLRQSGLGRELGRWGMDEFTEPRAISVGD